MTDNPRIFYRKDRKTRHAKIAKRNLGRKATQPHLRVLCDLGVKLRLIEMERDALLRQAQDPEQSRTGVVAGIEKFGVFSASAEDDAEHS